MPIDPKSLVSGIDLMPDEQIGLQRIRLAQQSDEEYARLKMQKENRTELLRQREQQLRDNQLDQLGKLVAVDYSKVYQERDRNEIMQDVENLHNEATQALISDPEFKSSGTLSWKTRSEIEKKRAAIDSKIGLAEANQKIISDLSKQALTGTHVDNATALSQVNDLLMNNADKSIQDRYNMYSSYKMPMKNYVFDMAKVGKQIGFVKENGLVNVAKTKQIVKDKIYDPGVYENYQNWKNDRAKNMGIISEQIPEEQWKDAFAESYIGSIDQSKSNGSNFFLNYGASDPSMAKLSGTPTEGGTEYDVSRLNKPFSGEVTLPNGKSYVVNRGVRSKVRVLDDGSYQETIVVLVDGDEKKNLLSYGAKPAKEGVEVTIPASPDTEEWLRTNKVILKKEPRKIAPKGGTKPKIDY